MAHHIEQTLKVNVPVAKLWKVMNDYAAVEQYATTIKSSPIVNDIKTGLGAKRLCNFNDGSSLVEEIIEYQEGQGYRMELSEHSLPLKSMFSEIRVKEIDTNSSELYMSSDFVVKAGPIGWIMGFLLMRPMMKGVFKNLMSGLAYYTASGERVGEKLPSSSELVKFI